MADIRKILAWLYIASIFIAVFKGIWWAVGFAMGLSIMIALFSLFYERNPLPKNASFVEKVQRRLRLSFVKVSIVKAKPKRIIGGFVIPIIPAFIKVSYQSEKMKLEALIHELCHIHYFIYGFQIVGFLLMVELGKHPALKWGMFVLFLLFQEFLTFRLTRKIGKEFGIETRVFEKKIVFKYILVYSTVASLAYLTLYVLSPLISFPLSIVLFFVAVKTIDLSFWYLFKAIDKIIGAKK